MWKLSTSNTIKGDFSWKILHIYTSQSLCWTVTAELLFDLCVLAPVQWTIFQPDLRMWEIYFNCTHPNTHLVNWTEHNQITISVKPSKIQLDSWNRKFFETLDLKISSLLSLLIWWKLGTTIYSWSQYVDRETPPHIHEKIAKNPWKQGNYQCWVQQLSNNMRKFHQTGTVTFPHYVINHQGWVCL